MTIVEGRDRSVAKEAGRTLWTASTRARTGVVAGATLAAVVVWVIADPLLGIDLAADVGGQRMPLGIGPVIATSLLSGLLGWGSLAALERLSDAATRTWVVAASVVTLLSLLPTGSATTRAATVVLVVLHVVVAAVLIPGLARPSGDR